MGGGGEVAAVADLDEESGSGSDPDSGHRDQDLGERGSLQQFLDPPGEEFALVEDGLERDGQARDDQRGGVGAGGHHGLFVQRGENLLDQALGRAGCLRPQQRDQPPAACLAYRGGGPEPFQQGQDGRELQSRAQDPFQQRVIWASRPWSRFATRVVSPVRSSPKPTIISSSAIASSSKSTERSMCGIARAASAMMNASLASVSPREDRGRRSTASSAPADGRRGSPCPGRPQAAELRSRPVLVDHDQHRPVFGLEFREQFPRAAGPDVVRCPQPYRAAVTPARWQGAGSVDQQRIEASPQSAWS